MDSPPPQTPHVPDDACEQDESRRELERRVLYAMWLPGVRLSRAFNVALKEAGEWVELAYLREFIDEGVKLKDAAGLLDVSVRKVSQLASRLRENFFAPEVDHELPARVEFALWASPLSRKRIKQYLASFDEALIDGAIDALIEKGRVREVPGRTTTYEVVYGAARLVGDDLMSRIDALNTMLSNVTDAIFGRFFHNEQRAFVRSLQFRIRPEDLPKLRALYEESVWEALRQLDERARDDPDAIPMGATLCWAPMDLTLDAISGPAEHEPETELDS